MRKPFILLLLIVLSSVAWPGVAAPAFGPATPLTPPTTTVGHHMPALALTAGGAPPRGPPPPPPPPTPPVGHHMPALALTAGGATVIWYDDATRAGSAAAGQSIASDAVITPDPTPYRDAAATSMGNESYVTW